MPRGNPGGYIPGARISDIRKTAGARDAVFIGERGGTNTPGGAMRGFNSMFSSGYVDKGFGPVGAGRRIPVEAGTQSAMNTRLNAAVNARRAQNLASMDPGLSTRGVTPASGSRLRGLEGRGTRPMPGTRMRPTQGPMYGPGRGEMAAANRQFRGNLMSNIEASRAGRTGGFRSGNMNGRTINRAIDINSRNRGIMGNIAESRAARDSSRFRNAQGFVGEYGPTRMDLEKIHARDMNRTRRMSAINRAKYQNEARKANAARTSMTSTAAGGGLPGAGAASAGGRSTGAASSRRMGGLLDNMKNGKLLAVGAGALVLGAAIGNRREKGTSSGRSSMYRY